MAFRHRGARYRPCEPCMTEPTVAELYLQDFHQRQVGVTPAAFAHLPAMSLASSASYASSYAMLAGLVPDMDTPQTVLDLGCGDGHLLALLAARQQPQLQLIGVDMSAAELAAARAILPPSKRSSRRCRRCALATGARAPKPAGASCSMPVSGTSRSTTSTCHGRPRRTNCGPRCSTPMTSTGSMTLPGSACGRRFSTPSAACSTRTAASPRAGACAWCARKPPENECLEASWQPSTV